MVACTSELYNCTDQFDFMTLLNNFMTSRINSTTLLRYLIVLLFILQFVLYGMIAQEYVHLCYWGTNQECHFFHVIASTVQYNVNKIFLV